MPRKAKKEDFIFAVGKRKTSRARVRLFKGKGENIVNDKPISEYFPGEVAKASWTRPFEVTNSFGKYFVSAKVSGGGIESQLDSFVHGVARALSQINPDFRFVIKKAGLLTRDARIRERRKIGMGGKSRRKKQSPKR